MTSEQIAELRTLTHRCRGGLPPCECDIPEYLGDDGKGRDAPLPVLQKLLDEREALLGALKRATDAIAAEWGDSSAQELRAIIAKAEAP
ncbi:MAG TPA: hypothetical protein VGI97_00720 [Gemmatimonadaceae bacterium]|jgi:hypothetical protein